MSTLPIPPNVEEIAAPLMLGILWNWTLYGVLVVQIYIYSYNFPDDRTLLKLLVYSVFLVETLQTAFTGTDLYYWFVSGFGNMDRLTTPYMSEFDVPIIGSIVSFTVQLFFVYRIWILSGKSSWFICLSICLCSIVGTVAAFYLGASTHVYKEFPSGFEPGAVTWLSGNALSDILIAGSMLFYLKRVRGDGHFSDHAFTRIVRLTVETNVLTTTVGIVSLLMVVFFPHKTYFTCPTAILGKLYSNTLLVSLNNRISIREGHGTAARSQGAAFALTTLATVEIVQMESMKPSGAGSWEDSAGQDASEVFDIA